MHTTNHATAHPWQINECVKIAYVKVLELSQLLDTSLKGDEQTRYPARDCTTAVTRPDSPWCGRGPSSRS